MPRFIQSIPLGAYDIVGDVHGHVGSLDMALDQLGYSQDGVHPAGRRLIFLGDLVDRGPDSIRVADRVAKWVQGGLALCVLGNHELNLLMGRARQGNEWWHGQPQFVRGCKRILPQRQAQGQDRHRLLEFFQSLPLALENDELKIVHACWHAPSVDRLRRVRGLVGPWSATLDQQLMAENPHAKRTQEWELILQNEHPVRVLTSGLEARWQGVPFQASGQPRRLARVPWWEAWREPETVVFGHYWRSQNSRKSLTSIPGPFRPGPSLTTPLGPRGHAWCVDFSNGHREEERLLRPWSRTTVAALGVLRWPERELILI